MGYGTGAIKLNLELWQRGFFRDIKSVIEMGSQELHLSRAQFDRLLHAAGISTKSQEYLRSLGDWSPPYRPSAGKFYELLGAPKYTCIDLGGKHESIQHDLNLPLTDSELAGQFDLVTDHCTNPHVFNIAEAYRTMHRLCRTGGIMEFIVPLYSGNGYYNFDPSFFEGMAAANNYRIIFSSFLVTITRKYPALHEEVPFSGVDGDYGTDEFHIPLSNELMSVIDLSNTHQEVDICYVVQKQSDDDFRFAYQNENLLFSERRNEGYELQFLPDPPSRSYLTLHSLAGGPILDSIGGKTLLRFLIYRFVQRVKALVRLR